MAISFIAKAREQRAYWFLQLKHMVTAMNTSIRKPIQTQIWKRILGIIVIPLCTLGLAVGAYAEKPDDPGNPGNGSGGKPDNPGGGGGKPDQPGRGKGDAYSDLVLLYRNVNGLPLYVEVPANPAPEAEEPGGPANCLQPLTLYVDDPFVDEWAAIVGLDNPMLNPAYGGDGPLFSPVPLGGSGLEGEECDVNVDYTAYTREVLFGRLNLGRSPEKVLSQQLRDVIDVLSGAETLALDEAGRLAADGVEIDSPGQNLAIHTELQVNTVLTARDQTTINLPVPPVPGYGFLDHAAAALGAAADKTGLVDLDLVIYNNRILGIPDATIQPTLTGDGTVGEAGRKYVDYTGYAYDRGAKYRGCFWGLDTSTVPASEISGTIIDLVFEGVPFTGYNVYGFAQNADDTRAVINYVHGNITYAVDRVGEEVVCDALGL